MDDDLDDLLGAYALDAVNEDERKLIEAYLLRSPTARAEVQRHHEVAAAISTNPGETPAPLWLRIEAILNDRAHSESTMATPELRFSKNTSTTWSPADEPRPQSIEPRVESLGSHPESNPEIPSAQNKAWYKRRRSGGGSSTLSFVLASLASRARRTGIAGIAGIAGRAGIAFTALAIVSLGARVGQLNSTNRSLQREANAAKRQGTQMSGAVKAETKRADALAAKLLAASKSDVRLEKLLASPSTKTVTLTSVSGAALAKVVVGADGKGYLLGGELPTLPNGHTYQLWGMHNPTGAGDSTASTVLSLGVFGLHPVSVAFAADSTDSWQSFALTDEKSPGVVTSKQPTIAAGNVEPS